ncbi:hypothetical protein D3C78_1410890 [compost metagenome]
MFEIVTLLVSSAAIVSTLVELASSSGYSEPPALEVIFGFQIVMVLPETAFIFSLKVNVRSVSTFTFCAFFSGAYVDTIGASVSA